MRLGLCSTVSVQMYYWYCTGMVLLPDGSVGTVLFNTVPLPLPGTVVLSCCMRTDICYLLHVPVHKLSFCDTRSQKEQVSN